MPNPPRKNWAVRIVVALICLSLAAWVSLSIFHAFRSTPDQVKLVNYDDYVVKVFDLVKQEVERFFEMAVLVLGGIWALAVIDKDQKLMLSDYPELAMFIVSTATFVALFYFLQQYDEIVKQVVWDVRALPGDTGQKLFPDVLNSPYLTLHYEVVVRCFYSGLATSGLTALSLSRLR